MNSRIGARRFALRILVGSFVCIAALSVGFAATTTYTYDMHGRLTSVTRDGVLQVTYAYDNAGKSYRQIWCTRVDQAAALLSF